MAENRKTYRIRTGVGNEAPSSINVNLTQTFDTVDVLSLEINQENFYKMPSAGYGVIVGRVLANGGFGIPNAKVSVFIPYDRNSLVEDKGFLYHYTTPMSKDGDGIRYNLLPRHLDDECHQDVGTMYEKEYLLDNNDLIQVFDKYYKYTAVTNKGGDYFIYGVPVGTQTVHVDLDLSDIGVLSQRPRDMIYKGFGADMFDSPNKFKKSKNLNELPQIYTQDNIVNVYPFWGDTSVDETNGVITRCDISIDYTFEPTCVFIGSMVSDTANRAISQRCVPDDEIGKMSELIAGEGKIEMIRKTFDGKVEEFQIRSNNLIDGDGVWCYQIPMNLDYVVTDEFGNIVPTDNPSKGIPTRTRVRFRMSMNETVTDETARKRARFLVPNNPKLNSYYPDFSKTHEADYEFGTFTKEESYKDLFWNKVYTVKSYIPRLQKAKALRRRVHTGIKNTNHSGANNPFPFNNLFIRLTFTYRFLCTLMTIFCYIVYGLNNVLGDIGVVLYWLGDAFHSLRKWLIDTPIFDEEDICFLDKAAYRLLSTSENITISLDNFCDDGNFDSPSYIPMRKNHKWLKIMNEATNGGPYQIVINSGCLEDIEGYEGGDYVFRRSNNKNIETNLGRLFNCIENQLAQDQECTSFNFSNDWVNGVLYAPLWYRKVRSKKRIFFNLIPVKAKDKWCSANSRKFAKGLSLCQTCAQKRNISADKTKIHPIPYENITVGKLNPVPINENTCYGYKCHKKTVSFIKIDKGLIVPVETMFGDTVYYYKSVEYDNTNLRSQDGNGMGDVKILFATDIVLLGSLNECDIEGLPQFFKRLESTTYNMPPDLVQIDYDSDSEKLKFEKKTSDSGKMNEMGFGDKGLSDVDDEIDETDAINPEDVYTDKSGADWGNFGRDQVTDDYKINNGYIFPTGDTVTNYAEFPDVGGLFYGLTCWSAYTKPKSCVNLSRVCEYGVSLDETQENPVYGRLATDEEAYEHMAPDGFISYDELYDKDGRAMFATMNGNNLHTITNPDNGFPVYEFMFLYPENFDGTMKNIMMTNVTPALYPTPQNNNYKAEDSSEAYLRFRYGRNKVDRSIDYYDSKTKIGLYGNSENNNRFPKYENSFYFYFGLNPGKTAIDKFRTQYYSECKDTDGEHAVISVEFEGNGWCSELTYNGELIPGDGWLKLDATHIDAPYDVYFANMDGHVEYDVWVNGIEEPKVYFSIGDKPDFEDDGYTHKSLFRYDNNGVETQYGLMNGTYRVTIVDANGEEYKRSIEYTHPKIMANISRMPFRMKNEKMREDTILNTGDFYNNVATLGGGSNQTMSDRTRVGGFIEVTNIHVNGDRMIDFMIEISPYFSINAAALVHVIDDVRRDADEQIPDQTFYNGSKLLIYQISEEMPANPICYDNTLMKENFASVSPYCPYGYDFPQYPEYQSLQNSEYQTNGGNYDFRFGVPIGGKKYLVTVTMLCKKGNAYYSTRNYMSTIIEVPEPIDFKMLINGVNYDNIRDFGLSTEEDDGVYYGTGWKLENNGSVFPENYVVPADYKERIVGWNDLDNIDGLELIESVPEGSESEIEWNYENHIKDCELKLVNAYSQSTTRYNWVGDYKFEPESVFSTIGKYETVPEVKQSGVAYVMVLTEGEYVYYKWNGNSYTQYIVDGAPVTVITTQEYYDDSDIEVKNNYISLLNNIITLRKEFVEQMKNAFIMRNDNEYTLEVRSVTNEVPVKTLICYSPDTENGISNDFEVLDAQNKSEKICYGITNPTLTGVLVDSSGFVWENGQTNDLACLGDLSFKPISNSSIDKKPYLIAVQNYLSETLPENIQMDNQTIDTPLSVLSKNLFGVHMLDKRLRFVYNIWSMAYEWAYYGEKNDIGGSMSHPHYKTITSPGLFAGFILDGVPDSYNEEDYPVTFFKEQKIDNKPISIKTLSVDGNHQPKEDRFPVVRLVYDEDVNQSIYVDYRFSDINVDNLINGLDIEKKCLVYTDKYSQLTITDKYGTKNLILYEEVSTPIVNYEIKIENNNVSYAVEAVFEEGWYYTYYNGIDNPVYDNHFSACMSFSSPYLPNSSSLTGKMFFGNNHFSFNNETNNSDIIIQPYGVVARLSIKANRFRRINNIVSQYIPITTMYAVRISKDLQRRTISKTFDLTLMTYMLCIEPQFSTYETTSTNQVHKIVAYVNVGVRKGTNLNLEEGFYYLKYHDFSISFMNKGDDNLSEIKTVEIKNGYRNGDIDIVDYNNATKAAKIVVEEYDSGVMVDTITAFFDQINDIDTCQAYLTDITGVKHNMLNTELIGGMNFSYILLNR